jgi:4-hydroxy-tetrahydrodipicolinate reductase
MIRAGLLGATGRMGQWVQKLAQEEFKDRLQITVAPGRKDDLSRLLQCDVVIDFALPEVMMALAKQAIAKPASEPLPAFAVGSTGWNLDGRRELEALATRTPVMIASNFSTGVAALLKILRQASPLLISHGYTPVITERHHVHKKDAPSGTAVSLQRAVSPAGPGNVQTVSIRAGEIIGDHEVSFLSPADELVFAHYAQDRSIFARGALQAAVWLAGKRGSNLGKPYSIENLFD